MMDYQTIRYETRDQVAVITYDRQDRRNAWNAPMYREVTHAVARANADEAVGAIVFTHLGPIYCAGADFRASPEPKDPVTGIRPSIATVSMALDDSWLHLLARSKPSIAAISGQAIGLGVTQILPMDIRIGGASSVYKFPFLALQFMPELGSTAILPRLVGYGRAMDICLTAATLDAEEALRIGLITRLVADELLLDEAVALGNRIAGFPRLQVELTRDLIRRNHLEEDCNAYLQRETDAFLTLQKATRAAKQGGSAA
jgi:2-(1,2-epoxy-1,2-dihydrophenyl)acetyl-CoA isomerase